MKRILVATAIALLILAFTATAALAHGRHAMQVSVGCKNSCPEYRAQVAGEVKNDAGRYYLGKDFFYKVFS